jgi:hypothetical protein
MQRGRQHGCHEIKNTMKLLVLSFFVLLLSIGCKRTMCCEPPAAFEDMVRVQTQCADPWGYGSNDAQTISQLRDYLTQKKIFVGEIQLLSTGEQVVCQTCNCSKGFKFNVRAAGQNIDSLKNEGFALK